MSEQYHLYTDESGEFSPKRYKKSPLFMVIGCIVETDDLIKVKHMLDLIKYKYWNNTNINLHSKNIGRKEKDFSIFKKNISLFNSFTKDIQKIISESKTSILVVITNQEEAFKKGWESKKVIKETYAAIYRNYIRMLVKKKATGKFIQEMSTPFQDIKIYEKFFEYQTTGLSKKINHEEVKKRLTSISFSTKRDNNSLTEIADILGYGIFLDYMIEQKKIKLESLNNYQKMVRSLAKYKLTNITCPDFKAIEIIQP